MATLWQCHNWFTEFLLAYILHYVVTLFSKSYKKTADEITSLIYFVTKSSNIIW